MKEKAKQIRKLLYSTNTDDVILGLRLIDCKELLDILKVKRHDRYYESIYTRSCKEKRLIIITNVLTCMIYRSHAILISDKHKEDYIRGAKSSIDFTVKDFRDE